MDGKKQTKHRSLLISNSDFSCRYVTNESTQIKLYNGDLYSSFSNGLVRKRDGQYRLFIHVWITL